MHAAINDDNHDHNDNRDNRDDNHDYHDDDHDRHNEHEHHHRVRRASAVPHGVQRGKVLRPCHWPGCPAGVPYALWRVHNDDDDGADDTVHAWRVQWQA